MFIGRDLADAPANRTCSLRPPLDTRLMCYLPAYILTAATMMLFPYWTVLALASLVR